MSSRVSPYTYYAFICYNNVDGDWAEWLQRRIEKFRFPQEVLRLHPELPEVISPIFMDKTDLIGGVLSRKIKEGLDSSRSLVVICSPHAAQSEWVGDEVQHFIDAGRAEDIIPFIIEGEPYSSAPDKQCFPPPLLALKGQDAGMGGKEITGIRINESGRDVAVCKVVASLFPKIQLDVRSLWDSYRVQVETEQMALSVVDGKVKKRDKYSEARLYEIASAAGDIRSMYQLAIMVLDQSLGKQGQPIERAGTAPDRIFDKDYALGRMLEAAQAGLPEAVWWMARHKYTGNVVDRDVDDAFRWLNILTDSVACPPRTWFLIGECYLNGYGTVVNLDAALKAFLHSFDCSGLDKWGQTAPDSTPVKSFDWWKKNGGELGGADIRTIRSVVGKCYYYGKGVARDFTKALKYLLLSAKEEDCLFFPPDIEAAFLIGESYYYHRGTKQDISSALFWLKYAAYYGSVEAKSMLDRYARKHNLEIDVSDVFEAGDCP